MPLSKLQFRPGIVSDLTSYSQEGGWRDGDKIRFRLGYPEKIGGWSKNSENTYLGSARALHNWIALDGSNYVGVGTHLKYYLEEGGSFIDITPIRETTAAGDVTFSATNGSTTITVTDTSHGAQQNDFVTYSGAVSLGGVITADVLNQEYQIIRVIDANIYEITSSVAANSSDSGNGGSSVVGAYQVNVGLDTSVGGTGWGAGLYGGLTNTGALQTTLNEGGTLSSVDTTVTVTSATGIAINDIILVGDPTAVPVNLEFMFVTGISTNDLTVVRGHAGGGASSNTVDSNSSVAAKTHPDGSTVTLIKGNSNSDNDYFGWGNAASGGITPTTQIRLWTHDNFGEDILINPKNSNIYYWDKSNGTDTRAIELKDLSGTKTSVPQKCRQIMVSDRDRHVIAFGADNINASSSGVEGDGVQDPLLIRFSSQENPIDWYPAATNTAGDLRLGAGSEFITAIETKREILVWTDTALTSMRFIGPPFTFGLQQLSTNITIAGSNSVVSTEDFVFWMGIDNFYVHAGQTSQLPCTVKDHVFRDINLEQIEKVYAGVNSEFGEVMWLYPSANSADNDRYVIYNYLDKIWYYGTLSRSAWLDRGTRTLPIAAEGGYLYNHETGFDDDGSAMTSYIESGVMDIQDGDHFLYIRRIVPDITFVGSSDGSSPSATLTIKARNFPGKNFNSTGSGSVSRTQVTPVEEYTDQVDARIRGRSFAFRVESSALGSKWKLGSPRVDIRPDGRR